MKNDPKELIARFNCRCAETGKEIKKGDLCVYYPSSQSVFHIDSKQARSYRDWRFDCEWLNCNY